MTKTIVLIHGAWLNSASWEGFKARYEAKGYDVHAPDWPFDERTPAELRAAPDPELRKVGPERIADHIAAKIRALPEAPILIGHSAGGLLTQMMLDRGLGVAGVAIDPSPMPGVPIGPHAFISAAPVLLPFGSWSRIMTMSRKTFETRFAQTLPEDEKKAAYDRYVVPTPGKLYWDGLLGTGGRVRFGNPHRPPLLLIAGGKDLIADASMTHATYQRQKRSPSLTEFKLYPERSHWTCLDKGWEEVADFALDWAERAAVGAEPKKAA